MGGGRGAISIACHIRNLCPSAAIEDKIPLELWKGEGCDIQGEIDKLRVFGCKVWYLISPSEKKFDSKANEGISVSYDQQVKDYRIYLPKTRKIIISCHVRFFPPPWQRSNTPLFANGPHTKKRKLQASRTNVSKRQTNPPASQVTTHNRFAILEADDAMDTTVVVNTQHTPSIFIDDVIGIQSMTKTIQKEISKEEYKLKIGNNSVKILPTNPDAYRKLTKLLKTLNANFHTYQLKQERPFRVVLRNIHHSGDLDEPKFELLKHGHKVTNISNIRHRITKNPLSLFFIDIKQKKKNNKEIYNVNRLMNSIVKIEPPVVKKEIVQCRRCQKYSHTQKYCNHNFQCVKCAGTHPIDQCTKSPETLAKCIHCQGEHPANYKGCLAYKTLYNNKYPKLRPKEITKQEPRPQNFTTPSMSYTQAA